MRAKYPQLFITLLSIASLILPAKLAARRPDSSGVKRPARVMSSYFYAPMDINNVFNYYGNNGDGSFNNMSSTNEGFEFPIGSNKGTLIFEDGLVWTALKNGTLLCGGSTYNHGLQPGKILQDGTASQLPVADDPAKPEYRVYRVRLDIRPTTDANAVAAETGIIQSTELAYIQRYQNLTAGAILQQYWSDWNQWPASEGAPFTDANGVVHLAGGIGYDPATCIPGFPGADQTEWMVMNDVDSTLTQGLYSSNPIGLEVQRTIWAYKNTGALGNTIFISYKFINRSGVKLDSVYVSQWSDPDVGYALDDAVGCDTTRSLGYAYNGQATDANYSSVGYPPPAVGFDFLQGPVVPGAPTDSAIFDMRYVSGHRNLPMTAFSFFVNGNVTFMDPDLGGPNGISEWYNLMRGMASHTGQSFPSTVTGGSEYCYPGDPVTGVGPTFIGPAAVSPPNDVRMCLCSGPFTMNPGDTQQVVVAALAGQGADYLSSITALKANDDIVQLAYNHLFRVSSPEVSVTSSIVKGQMTTLSVRAGGHGLDASGISVALRKYDGTLVATSNLSDAGNGGFTGSVQVAQQQAGLYIDATVNYQNGMVITWPHVADYISTAGPVSVTSCSVASDNLNDDGIVNPGENIRYVFSLKNFSSFNFTDLTIHPNPSHDGRTISVAALNANGTMGLTYDPYNPSTYLSFDVPSYCTDTTLSVVLSITDLNHNLWADTITFRVVPLRTPVYYTRLSHTSGYSTGSFSISIVDSAKVKNHIYVINGIESVGSDGTPSYTLKDSTSNTILLTNQPLPDALGHTSPIVDGFKILIGTIDTLHGMANWAFAGTRHWTWSNATGMGLEGFTGAIGNAYDNWFSGSATTYGKLRDVEIRFAATDPSGNVTNSSDPNASYAYRYLRHADQSAADPSFAPYIVNTGTGYAFQDYKKSMPLAAYDVQAVPPRRLMVGFLENNATNGLVDGKYWPPYYGDPVHGDNMSSVGPREWFFVFDVPYSTTADAALETDILDNTVPMMWFGTVDRRDTLGWSSADTFRILAHHSVSSYDTWTFNPSDMVLTGVKQVQLPNSFELFQNFPNPFNPSTTIRFALPQASKVTIGIYNVLGQQVEIRNYGLMGPGRYDKSFDMSRYSSGVYFCVIEAVSTSTPQSIFREVKKLLLLK